MTRRAKLDFDRCLDCRRHCVSDLEEFYMVKDVVWSQAKLPYECGMVCIGCLENKLGRRLRASDFTMAACNWMEGMRRSARLQHRLRRYMRKDGALDRMLNYMLEEDEPNPIAVWFDEATAA